LSLIGCLHFATLSFSQNQTFAPNAPSWYIYNPNFSVLADKNGTHIAATIHLFRTGRRIFTPWNIYTAVECYHAHDDPNTPLQDGWMGCQEYPDAPEGEKELSPDVYERLKWRLVDLKVDNLTSKFEMVTIQVVNVLPAKV
jgi:hypothetical protein